MTLDLPGDIIRHIAGYLSEVVERNGAYLSRMKVPQIQQAFAPKFDSILKPISGLNDYGHGIGYVRGFPVDSRPDIYFELCYVYDPPPCPSIHRFQWHHKQFFLHTDINVWL